MHLYIVYAHVCTYILHIFGYGSRTYGLIAVFPAPPSLEILIILPLMETTICVK